MIRAELQRKEGKMGGTINGGSQSAAREQIARAHELR